MSVRPAGFQKPLHSRDDFPVHGLLVAGKWITGMGPCVREINADQRRPLAETDTSLKSAFLINFGRRIKCLLKHLIESTGIHAFHNRSPFLEPRSMTEPVTMIVTRGAVGKWCFANCYCVLRINRCISAFNGIVRCVGTKH